MTSVAEELIAAGICSLEGVAAVGRQLEAIGGGRLTDALVLSGWADERAVLRLLALRASTRFVTIERLREAKVEQDVLDRLPVEAAEQLQACPLRFDASSRTLLLAVADPAPETFAAVRQRVAAVGSLVGLVALERGVQAAIRRFYHGDSTAFEQLLREIAPSHPSLRGRPPQEAALSRASSSSPGKP